MIVAVETRNRKTLLISQKDNANQIQKIRIENNATRKDRIKTTRLPTSSICNGKLKEQAKRVKHTKL